MKRTDITDIFPEATAEQIDKLIGIHGADINGAKAQTQTLQQQLQAAQTELSQLKAAGGQEALNQATAQAAALQAELDQLKAANSLRDMRDKVASEHKVPASLLTGDTEEACAAQAKAILDFTRSSAYPQLKDGGEVTNIAQPTTREKFADWAKENL